MEAVITTENETQVSTHIAPVLVLGLGNILLQDEGVGVHVVRKLQREYRFPPGVELLDGGTAGMALYDDLIDRSHIIVIDAVNAGKPPGTLLSLTTEQVPSFFRNKVSPHQMALADILAALDIMGKKPADISVFGVQPKDLELGLELSETLQSCVDPLVGQVMARLQELGYAPERSEVAPAG
ncbi:MAG: HyaD/HybD family hydrogenase maturation endopeptidase [Pseudomonadota bacterium]|nr:MAG: HyaD/HybD family hydrogenase maturation endopeptidase [Pseudomonadota bacterium]